MAKLAAIITAYNRSDFVGRCVESVLREAGDGLDIEVVVMDNGSVDGTGEAARQAGARVERTEDNRHIVEVINRGFDLAYAIADVEYILYMNDDTEFTPGSLRKMVEACRAHPHGLMTPLQINYRQPGMIDDSAFEHLAAVRPLVEDALMERPLEEVYPLPTIIGAAMFARTETWRVLGEFDPLFWFYGIDDDLCTRARWLGFEILLVTHARLLHAHGKLDAEPQAASKAQRNMKWRNELQARYLFLLKDPVRSLAVNLFRATGHALDICFTNLRKLWPWGAWQSLAIFFHCVTQIPRIRDTRRRHFDPARKLDSGCEPK